VIAGVIEAKKNNTFGLTAFTSYGFFWLSLVGLIVIPKFGWAPKASDSAMCAYLALWGLFTLCLFFGTLRLNRALQFVFATLTILFILLAAEHAGYESVGKFAGYEGIICGLSAIYAGIANVLNEVYGKVVLPLGQV
jgi:succinate-acetate transporter protein